VLPFSNLGLGSYPARNWCWEHAISEGHAFHWILDAIFTALLDFIKTSVYRASQAQSFELLKNLQTDTRT